MIEAAMRSRRARPARILPNVFLAQRVDIGTSLVKKRENMVVGFSRSASPYLSASV